MVDRSAQTELVHRFLGQHDFQRTVFTADVIDRICAGFDIPTENRGEIGEVLEIGARQFIRGAAFSSLDFKSVRKELAGLEKAARSMVDAIANLTADTLTVLDQAGFATTLLGGPLRRISDTDQGAIIELSGSPEKNDRRIPLSELQIFAAALAQCSADARPIARTNRRGRPENEGLFDLMHFAFQIWPSILGREFKLDWTADTQPITDAARFCVAVAHSVEPSLSRQQIATAARKVRENSQPINDLEKLSEVAEHYRKQFE